MSNERPALFAGASPITSQQPTFQHGIRNQPAYPSTYQAQPSTYRDRQAIATYDALDAGDIHTANKRFEYLVRADGNDF